MLTSVATRSSVAGVGVPVVATFALQLIAFADAPSLFRLILPTTAFDGWHGLLAQPAFYGPIVLGTAVNVVCAAVLISIARRIFLRRNIV
jgi:ABC-2 type transport system permease protein